MKPFCAAVDWGTSRFRLWVLDSRGTVLHEINTDEGLQKSATTGYEAILEKHLANSNCPADLPVIICGMAGSRSGWLEAPYLDTPAILSDLIQHSVSVPHPTRYIKILPGIAQRNPDQPDVLRGEETQLFGMLNSLSNAASEAKQIVCMPGTHSKWVSVNKGKVDQFTTFMSGELFAVIAKQSILKMAVDLSQDVEPDNSQFLHSVRDSISAPSKTSAKLFSLRSSQLLGYTEPLSAKAALSGTIIGLEIAGAIAVYGKLSKVNLLASGNLARLYQSALNMLEIETVIADAESAGRDGLYKAACLFWDHHSDEKMVTSISQKA